MEVTSYTINAPTNKGVNGNTKSEVDEYELTVFLIIRLKVCRNININMSNEIKSERLKGHGLKLAQTSCLMPRDAVVAFENVGNPQKEDQGYVNSGCSRYMTGNMSISLTSKNLMEDMLPLGEEPKKEKLLVNELLKLLADESQGLLKVPRKNNMYSVDMKNIVPKESLTYLVAKATLDESMLSHRRLGHVYFKTINKLFKENLVRGLPTKYFENDQTCVACLKGKKHKASSTKDETSGILKSFITEIENLVDKK
nr:ribonuclease H-like domain-containing protein [Tanacetum cinerariifolium]